MKRAVTVWGTAFVVLGILVGTFPEGAVLPKGWSSKYGVHSCGSPWVPATGLPAEVMSFCDLSRPLVLSFLFVGLGGVILAIGAVAARRRRKPPG